MVDETQDPQDSHVLGDAPELQGAFTESLMRNNTKIKRDRAESIGEDASISYKREVEDTLLEIRKIRREQEAMMDLSPTNTQSLVLASDFDGKAWAQKDIELELKLRNLEIKYERGSARLMKLFGIKVV